MRKCESAHSVDHMGWNVAYLPHRGPTVFASNILNEASTPGSLHMMTNPIALCGSIITSPNRYRPHHLSRHESSTTSLLVFETFRLCAITWLFKFPRAHIPLHVRLSTERRHCAIEASFMLSLLTIDIATVLLAEFLGKGQSPEYGIVSCLSSLKPPVLSFPR